ncbi:MAG TPA: hypothetical protein IAC41_12855 [Candidatus Merdenecus merdavium]|nr:hypothetical protein [Candidatus Merdenecus merdavium]
MDTTVRWYFDQALQEEWNHSQKTTDSCSKSPVFTEAHNFDGYFQMF